MKARLLVVLLLATGSNRIQAQGAIVPADVPAWADSVFRHSPQFAGYDYPSLSPGMAIADFDGDGLDDCLVEVWSRSGLTRGLALIHRGDGSVHILGAGHDAGDGNDEIRDWALTRLRHHKAGIRVMRDFSPGGYLIWDGQAYRWTPAQ